MGDTLRRHPLDPATRRAIVIRADHSRTLSQSSRGGVSVTLENEELKGRKTLSLDQGLVELPPAASVAERDLKLLRRQKRLRLRGIRDVRAVALPRLMKP